MKDRIFSWKRWMSVLTAVVLLVVSTVTASAVSLPQMDRQGSVTVTIQELDTNKGLSDAVLEVYLVADAVYRPNDGYYHELTADFADSGFDPAMIENANAEELAVAIRGLKKYASDNALTPVDTKTTGKDGKAVFDELKCGLYLVINTEVHKNYSKIAPFLISVPQKTEDGGWKYDVDAAPKVGKSHSTGGSSSDGGSDSSTPGDSSTSSETPPEKPPHLPQTGQLWWPVFLMVGAGVGCFAYGWSRRKHSDDE